MFVFRLPFPILFATLVVAGASCGGEPAATRGAAATGARGAEHAASAAASKAPVSPSAAVPSFGPSLPPRVPRAAKPLRDAIRQRLEADAATGAMLAQRRDRLVRRQGAFARLLRQAYRKNDGPFVFFLPDGEAKPTLGPMLGVLRRLPAEAVPTAPYALERIESLVAASAELRAELDELGRCEGLGETQATLCRMVTGAPTVPTLEDCAARLREVGMADLDPAVVAFADEQVWKTAQSEVSFRELQVELDLSLLRAFFQFILDYRIIKRAHPDDVTLHPEQAPVEHRARLLAHFERGLADLPGHLRSLRPVNPIYERTVDALAYYRELAASGRVKRLRRKRLRKGRHAPGVRELKKRLAMEHYYAGPLDDHFGEDLTDAIKVYQRLHTLKADGRVGPKLYASLNIPLARRIHSLELSLQRWRESDIRAGMPIYARVNIPQFEVEFWEGDTLARAHRVIVGSNGRDRNLQAGVEGRLNHTRLFHATIETIDLNPSWTVPVRIKQYELDRELMENPTYYEEHGYEFKVTRGGRTIVTQKPGPTNALGKVKFLFPNEHSIYMHDTPKRRLFRRTSRAFSHGCIRTDEPLELARWLLTHVDGRPAARVDRLMRTKRERPIQLAHKVPIFIEYNTVTVDDEGRAGFFDDVYSYDRAYFEGKLPFERAQKIGLERLAQLRAKEADWRAELAAALEGSSGEAGDSGDGDGVGGEPETPAPPGGAGAAPEPTPANRSSRASSSKLSEIVE